MSTNKIINRAFLALALILGLVATASSATAASYTIDSTHSSAIFKTKHFGVSYFYGAFKGMNGTIDYDSENPSASSIEVTIEAESVDSRNSNRDEHIKSPDFLNVKQFPTITFKSTSVKASGEGLEVTGTLTLHGVTKEITITAEKVGEGKNPRSQKAMIGFHTEFKIQRSDFDMNFMIGPLSDDVTFILSLEAGE